ncbi:hypothetical protein MCUN1_002732 [Malassezia cuniculi]|uniref:Brl1/Brr6 domain-containing protein n=1 Tax=Malassezia cuniculi TaxID=948313 RepID=A0AAF0J7N6_9BASI|nr:hypothetical protein MCUN1_002732 [Malassezia cuniculi]
MDLRRGKQAPMDLSDSGVRQPSIFDQHTPDASLMDIDDTPTQISPEISTIEMEDISEREAAQTAPILSQSSSLAVAHAPQPSVSEAPPSPAPALSVADINAFKLGEKTQQTAVRDPHDSARLRRSPSKGILRRPDVLLGYAQVIFNVSVLLVALYVIFSVLWTVRKDVAEKVRDYELDYLSDIARCEQAYQSNNCGTQHQAPALAEACEAWLRCSKRSHTTVGHARIFAETMAEILNGFVDAVSWKTMLFFVLMVSMFVGAANSTFSFFRGAARQQEAPPVPPHMLYPHMYPPQFATVTSGWDSGHAPRLRIRAEESE